jgi:O-methyltransferase
MKHVSEFVAVANLDVPTRNRSYFPEIDDEVFWAFYRKAIKFSLVHVGGFYNAYQSVRYIARNRIPGDIVECGCFLGGMSIFLTLARNYFGLGDKTIFLLDTFNGFPKGQSDALFNGSVTVGPQIIDFESDVIDNFNGTSTPLERVQMIKGPVEITIPAFDVKAISLLRLDTDFYSSTKVALDFLYDKLLPGGVLIVDDYGMFQGSRRATDELLATLQSPPLLNRIDNWVWAGVKP